MNPSRDNARGILAMNVAVAALIVNDAFVKALSETLPLGEIMFLRGLVATLLIGGFCVWSGSLGAVRHLGDMRVAMRLVGEIGATTFYLAGLVRLPIGNATAMFQITPLAVTAGAAIFLGETVGWRRWTAIAVGFVGVMIIIRPSTEGLVDGAGFILGSVGFVVLRDLSTARIPMAVPTSLASLATSLTVTVAGLLYWPLDPYLSRVPDWHWVQPTELLQLLAAGTGLVAGYVFMTIAMRTGEMSVVAPFRYALLIWSFLVGLVAFGERPDAWTLIGAAIVVATGLYSFHRERVRARAAEPPASA